MPGLRLNSVGSLPLRCRRSHLQAAGDTTTGVALLCRLSLRSAQQVPSAVRRRPSLSGRSFGSEVIAVNTEEQRNEPVSFSGTARNSDTP